MCPTPNASRADSGKYEYSFEVEQPWVDIDRKLDFVTLYDGTGDGVQLDEIENDDPVSIDPSATETPSKVTVSSHGFKYSSSRPGSRNSRAKFGPPDYGLATEYMPSESPTDHAICSALSSPATAKQIVDMSVSPFNEMISASDSGPPLTTLKERNLFQHFVTHLTPWVRIGNLSRLYDLTNSNSSSMLETVRDTSGRSQRVWRCPIQY